MSTKVMDMAGARRRRKGAVTITSQGQVSIPRQVMRESGLAPGDQLQAIVDEQGRIILSPTTDWIEEFAGSDPDALSVEEIRRMRDEWDR